MVLMGQGDRERLPARLPAATTTRRCRSWRRCATTRASRCSSTSRPAIPGTKEWVQQVQARFHLPMVSGCTAVSAPEYYPYLQSGQLQGLLGGMAGAAEYEKLRGEKGTGHARAWTPSRWRTCSSPSASCSATSCSGRKRRRRGVSFHPTHDLGIWVGAAADAVHLQLPLQGQPVLQVRRAPVRRRVGRLLHRAATSGR